MNTTHERQHTLSITNRTPLKRHPSLKHHRHCVAGPRNLPFKQPNHKFNSALAATNDLRELNPRLDARKMQTNKAFAESEGVASRATTIAPTSAPKPSSSVPTLDGFKQLPDRDLNESAARLVFLCASQALMIFKRDFVEMPPSGGVNVKMRLIQPALNPMGIAADALFEISRLPSPTPSHCKPTMQVNGGRSTKGWSHRSDHSAVEQVLTAFVAVRDGDPKRLCSLLFENRELSRARRPVTVPLEAICNVENSVADLIKIHQRSIDAPNALCGGGGDGDDDGALHDRSLLTPSPFSMTLMSFAVLKAVEYIEFCYQQSEPFGKDLTTSLVRAFTQGRIISLSVMMKLDPHALYIPSTDNIPIQFAHYQICHLPPLSFLQSSVLHALPMHLGVELV